MNKELNDSIIDIIDFSTFEEALNLTPNHLDIFVCPECNIHLGTNIGRTSTCDLCRGQLYIINGMDPKVQTKYQEYKDKK